MNTLIRLSASKQIYVINIAKPESPGEGEVTYDGTKVYVNIENTAHEKYSFDARLAHELEHARQVEDGEMSFYNTDGKWKVSNYDINDEIKAHQAI